MSQLMDQDSLYIANTYSRFPIEIEKGEGVKVYDFDGKEYIDLGSGIGVSIFGFNDKMWKDAVYKQINMIQHTSNLYYSKPCVDLAKLLCEKTNMKKVFFSNSGAEANECAIKVARKYAQEKKGKEYYNIITLKNSFHGRTITTLAATGQDVFHQNFTPLTEGFLYATANDLNSVKELVLNNKVAAIMIECVQGEGGVIALDKEFIQGIYNICQDKDILMICDEVQTGNGRSGKLYSYMNYDVYPDIVTTAKGLGGGLPIGACILGQKVEKTLGFSDHGSTFGGNPVCAAGAVSIMNRIDDNLLLDVQKKSKFIFEELNNQSGIKSITGLGLMIGIETIKPAKEVVLECMKKGVICLTAKTKVRLLPALNIPMEDLKTAINVIKECAKVD